MRVTFEEEDHEQLDKFISAIRSYDWGPEITARNEYDELLAKLKEDNAHLYEIIDNYYEGNHLDEDVEELPIPEKVLDALNFVDSEEPSLPIGKKFHLNIDHGTCYRVRSSLTFSESYPYKTGHSTILFCDYRGVHINGNIACVENESLYNLCEEEILRRVNSGPLPTYVDESRQNKLLFHFRNLLYGKEIRELFYTL